MINTWKTCAGPNHFTQLKTEFHNCFRERSNRRASQQHVPPRPERTATASARCLRLSWGGSLLLLRRGRSALTLGLLLLGLASGSLGLVAIGGGPQGEVVTEQLHDESAVAVGLLREGVKLSNGIVEGLLSKVAGTVGRVKDLVVEDGEVQGETETDGVGRGELGLGNIGSVLERKKDIISIGSCFQTRD